MATLTTAQLHSIGGERVLERIPRRFAETVQVPKSI
jgi:hypothetical protein